MLSNGEMEVTLHPAASLGTAPQVLDLLVRNTVQVAGSMPSGVIASKYCPSLNALNIPYLFRDSQMAIEVLEAPEIKNHLNKKLEEAAGIRILSVLSEGQRHLTNSIRPIHTPADLKGLKIRVMEGDIYSTVFKSLELLRYQHLGLNSIHAYRPRSLDRKTLHEHCVQPLRSSEAHDC